MPLSRACLVCGTPTRNGSLCPAHATSTARGYDSDWRRLRVYVLNRDNGQCHWCGSVADTVDHVRPLAEGGARLDPDNLVAACRSCNSSRGASVRRRA